MKKLNALLVFLISDIAITGIAIIDGVIWNVVFIIVGEVAYATVGFLISLGVLKGKQNCKDAYAFIFFLLILGGFAIYRGLVNFKLWVISWPLFIKILVPSLFGLMVISILILVFVYKKRLKKEL